MIKNIFIFVLLFSFSTVSMYANYGETFNYGTNQEKIYTATLSLNSDKYGINGDFLKKFRDQCKETREAYSEDIELCNKLNFTKDIRILKNKNVLKIKSFLDTGGFSFISYLTLPPGEDTSSVVISRKYQDGILFIAQGEGESKSSGHRFWFLRYASKWDELQVYTIAIPNTGSTNADFIKSFKKNKFYNSVIQKVYQDILTTADRSVIK